MKPGNSSMKCSFVQQKLRKTESLNPVERGLAGEIYSGTTTKCELSPTTFAVNIFRSDDYSIFLNKLAPRRDPQQPVLKNSAGILLAPFSRGDFQVEP